MLAKMNKPLLVKKGRDKASKSFRLHVSLLPELIQLMPKHQPLVSSKFQNPNKSAFDAIQTKRIKPTKHYKRWKTYKV